MAADITKQIVVPIDGSENAKKSLAYLSLIFGPDHPLHITLLYILPTLPPILVEEQKRNKTAAQKIKQVEEKNIEIAKRFLLEAKEVLIANGFQDNRIKRLYRKKDVGVAKDICRWADTEDIDAVMVTTKGRTRLQAFFMGEVSRDLLEYCPVCPIWMLEPVVRKKGVLIAIDSSKNALRAADHAGFILSGTDCPVTLFHSKRQLKRFVPDELLKEAPELEEAWKQAAGEQVGPYLEKAKEKLLTAGLNEDQITIKVVDGSRSAAVDIQMAAKRYDCGTIVLGRRGLTGVRELIMGSVTRKVLEGFSGTAVWIVR